MGLDDDMNKLLNNKGPALILVLILLVLAVLFWSNRSDAEGITRVAIGPTAVSSQFSDGIALTVSEVWNDRYLLGFGLIGQQTARIGEKDIQIGNNIMFRAQFLVQGPAKWAWARQIELGLGLGYLQEKSEVVGSNLNFALSVAWESPDRWDKWWQPDRFTFDHLSNSGSAKPNPGLNMLMFGYDFGY